MKMFLISLTQLNTNITRKTDHERVHRLSRTPGYLLFIAQISIVAFTCIIITVHWHKFTNASMEALYWRIQTKNEKIFFFYLPRDTARQRFLVHTKPTQLIKMHTPRTQPKKHQTHCGFLRSIGIVCKSTSASSSTRKLKVFVKYEATQNMHSPLPCPLFLVKISLFLSQNSPQKDFSLPKQPSQF